MIKHIEVEEICIKQVVNNPIYINGFFLYYFPCQEVVGAEKEIFEDVKTFIDQGFMILTGEEGLKRKKIGDKKLLFVDMIQKKDIFCGRLKKKNMRTKVL